MPESPDVPVLPMRLSGLEPVSIAAGSLFVNIGERTNVTGSKAFARMILEGRVSLNGKVLESPAVNVTGEDIHLLFGHDFSRPLASRATGTLEIDPVETPTGSSTSSPAGSPSAGPAAASVDAGWASADLDSADAAAVHRREARAVRRAP